MNSRRMSNVISPTVPIYRMLTDEWARTILVFRHSGDSNRRVLLCPSIDGSPTDGHKLIINSKMRQAHPTTLATIYRLTSTDGHQLFNIYLSSNCIRLSSLATSAYLSTENRSMGTNRSQTVPIYRPSADEWARTIQQIEV